MDNEKILSYKHLLKLYVVFLSIVLICGILLALLSYKEFSEFLAQFNYSILAYVIIGFIAQLIDGMLGMAYGVTSTSFLLSTGLPPAVASSSVHFAEIFTTGISGLTHWHFKNVDRRIFLQLLIPGVIGATIGAYGLSSFDGSIIKPFISAYLFIVGIRILYFAFIKKKNNRKKIFKNYSILGFLGGFIDACGGGGWGPIVTSTLITSSENPKRVIGSVNATEFFITLVSSGIFSVMIGLKFIPVSMGLIVGGILSAPLAVYLCNRINNKTLLIFVGFLIISLCIITFVKLLL